jgi:hypothetical protein
MVSKEREQYATGATIKVIEAEESHSSPLPPCLKLAAACR